MTLNGLKTLLASSLFLIFLSSCEKPGTPPTVEQPIPPNPVEKSVGGTAPLPLQHDGALYMIRTITFDNGGIKDTTLKNFAWFGNSTKTQSAGTVAVNGINLRADSGDWYNGPSFYYGPEIFWSTTGTDNFPAFEYTDLTEFGALQSKAIPPAMARNESLTASFTTGGGNNAAVIASVTDGTGRWVSKSVASGLQTVTFTNKELAQLLATANTLTFQIMPIVTTMQVLGGKNYYLVKQAAYQQKISVNT